MLFCFFRFSATISLWSNKINNNNITAAAKCILNFTTSFCYARTVFIYIISFFSLLMLLPILFCTAKFFSAVTVCDCVFIFVCIYAYAGKILIDSILWMLYINNSRQFVCESCIYIFHFHFVRIECARAHLCAWVMNVRVCLYERRQHKTWIRVEKFRCVWFEFSKKTTVKYKWPIGHFVCQFKSVSKRKYKTRWNFTVSLLANTNTFVHNHEKKQITFDRSSTNGNHTLLFITTCVLSSVKIRHFSFLFARW